MIRIQGVLRIIGLLLMVFSLTMLPPIGVTLIYPDSPPRPFVFGFLIIFSLGLIFWFPFRNHRKELRMRDGFLIVVIFWLVFGAIGAVPFVLSEHPHMRITDAVFESISGLTTTGATVLTGLDRLPHSILYYRQQLQWLGGMGIVVLAVAILPVLGVGGLQLYRAETPGPVKDVKLTPRITETAKALWRIYLAITIFCGLGYWSAGMSAFDAIGHAFSTVAIGGFSTHDSSFAYFDSARIEIVAIIFMVLSGINFSLHFTFLNKRSLRVYSRDSEFRGYLLIMVMVIAIVWVHLFFQGTDYAIHETFLAGVFQVVSFVTTSGFTSAEFYLWPGFLPVLLVLTAFIGGCAGSTAGGMKVIRVILIYKQGMREIVRLIHPSAWVPIKVGNQRQPHRVIDAVWGFFALYVVSYIVLLLLMMEAGLDELSAISAVGACLNNLGPGLGEVATGFSTVSDAGKWVACIAMLLGRLEVFTLLVLLSPAYWRN